MCCVIRESKGKGWPCLVQGDKPQIGTSYLGGAPVPTPRGGLHTGTPFQGEQVGKGEKSQVYR